MMSKLIGFKVLAVLTGALITLSAPSANTLLAERWYCSSNEPLEDKPEYHTPITIQNYELRAEGSADFAVFLQTSQMQGAVLLTNTHEGEEYIPVELLTPVSSGGRVPDLEIVRVEKPFFGYKCWRKKALRDHDLIAAESDFNRQQELKIREELWEKRHDPERLAIAETALAEAHKQNLKTLEKVQIDFVNSLTSNWVIPEGTVSNTKAVLGVHLLHSGDILDAYIHESSGNGRFDLSVLQAVSRIEQFQMISAVDPILFRRHLSRIFVTFRPTQDY